MNYIYIPDSFDYNLRIEKYLFILLITIVLHSTKNLVLDC